MSEAATKEPHEDPVHILESVRSAVSQHTSVSATDAQGVITFVNQRFCNQMGFTERELLGTTHAKLGSGLHHAEFFAEMWQTISQGSVWRGEICSRTGNGSLLWEDIMIIPVLDADGAVESYVSIRIEPTYPQMVSARQVQRLAYIDSVTGLANRSALLRTLSEYAAHGDTNTATGTADRVDAGGVCGLIVISIDEYSTMNDAFGFDAGDSLMLQAATKFREALGEEYMLSRVGPGTFGVLLPRVGGLPSCAEAACRTVIELIRNALACPKGLVAGVKFAASTSVGFALFSCEATASAGLVVSRDASEILKCAEVARKHARLLGGDQRICRFDESMLVQAQDRVKFATELREGIEQGQLRLYAQPIVNAERRFIGAEALVRWAHPLRGQLLPDEFIPLAEHTGMIVEVGAWVLEYACATLNEWGRRPETADHTLSINLSEHELRAEGFSAQMRGHLERYGVTPGKLRVELTERMWHRDMERTVEALHLLRELGVSAALDDFGTGYSSLSYLHTFPVEQLKVDRSFVSSITVDSQAMAVIRAIVDMARIMGLQVVAEGIETEAQFALLRDLGVDAFQGFLFGQPVPIEELVRATSH